MGAARLVRCDGTDPDVSLLVAEDGSKALARILRCDTASHPVMPRIRLAGLEPEAHYALTETALSGDPAEWPLGTFSGAGLMGEGLDLDPIQPQTGRIILLEGQTP